MSSHPSRFSIRRRFCSPRSPSPIRFFLFLNRFSPFPTRCSQSLPHVLDPPLLPSCILSISRPTVKRLTFLPSKSQWLPQLAQCVFFSSGQSFRRGRSNEEPHTLHRQSGWDPSPVFSARIRFHCCINVYQLVPTVDPFPFSRPGVVPNPPPTQVLPLDSAPIFAGPCHVSLPASHFLDHIFQIFFYIIRGALDSSTPPPTHNRVWSNCALHSDVP